MSELIENPAPRLSRLIKPGYHIRPAYDLHGLRNRRNLGQKGHIVGELPLTSLIDMFSILVIYLLMNFSATGEIFFLNKNLILPKAFSTHALTTAPLISIEGSTFVLDAPDNYHASPVRDNSTQLESLTAALKAMKATAESQPELIEERPLRVNLQADENTPIEFVKRAMNAAFMAGWSGINFVVQKEK